MDTHEKYSRDGMQEGDPGSINPNESGQKSPAKAISEKDKLYIKESVSGHNETYKAAEEHIDDGIGQIDEETKNMRSDAMDQTKSKQFDTSDFYRVDERDQNDSTEDWDAEKSRTGNHK